MLALQSAATLSAFGATAVTGRFVAITMIRELGPVLTGVMVSGRNASSMASELGSMVVTEQIDAMRALGVDPMRKLVTPRIFACISMLFFLTIVADAFGIIGGAFVTVFMNHQDGLQYFSMAWESLRYPDILQGLVKPLFSGYIIASIGCFYGLRTTGGTQGVGRSTIQAVVCSSVLIIVADFFLTQILLAIFLPHEPPTPNLPQNAFRRSARLRRLTRPGRQSSCVSVLAFNYVSIAFDGPPVLEDISFSVAPGETRILLGPAGVGKSVLLKLANGLLRPDKGSIQLFGEEISTMPEEQLFPLRTRIGMVFQEGALFDSLTVRDNVAYQLIQEHVPDDEIDTRVREALTFVGLEQTFSFYPVQPLRRHEAPRRHRPRRSSTNPNCCSTTRPPAASTPSPPPPSSNSSSRSATSTRPLPCLVTHRLQDAFTLCTHYFDQEKAAWFPCPKARPTPTPPSSCSTKAASSSTAPSTTWSTLRTPSSANSSSRVFPNFS